MSLWCQRLHNTKLCLLWDIFQGEAAASGLGASEGSYQGDLQESWGGRWTLPTVYVRCRIRSRPGRVFSVRSCSLSSTPPPREILLSPQHLSHSTLSSQSYSALKKDGQRLSTLMKRGEAVEARPARLVTVYSISLLRFQPPLFTLGRTESFGIICFVRIFTWCLSNVEEELFVGSQPPG